MGKEEQEKIAVVLDTNVMVSALLFGGRLKALVDLWMKGRVVLLVTEETVSELISVLTYPKFDLSHDYIQQILEQFVFPFVQTVKPRKKVSGVLADADDEMFLTCAKSGGATYVVTGDGEFLSLGEYEGIKIVSPADFLNLIS